MRCTIIPRDDFNWLEEVHGVKATRGNVVLVYGDESSPSKIEVYDFDHFQSPLTVWGYEGDNDKMTITQRVPGISKEAAKKGHAEARRNREELERKYGN